MNFCGRLVEYRSRDQLRNPNQLSIDRGRNRAFLFAWLKSRSIEKFMFAQLESHSIESWAVWIDTTFCRIFFKIFDMVFVPNDQETFWTNLWKVIIHGCCFFMVSFHISSPTSINVEFKLSCIMGTNL